MSRFTLIFVAILIAISYAVAARQPEKKAVVANTAEKFDLLATAIQQEIAPGKRFEFLSNGNRQVVNHSLDRMAQMSTAAGSVEALSQED